MLLSSMQHNGAQLVYNSLELLSVLLHIPKSHVTSSAFLTLFQSHVRRLECLSCPHAIVPPPAALTLLQNRVRS